MTWKQIAEFTVVGAAGVGVVVAVITGTGWLKDLRADVAATKAQLDVNNPVSVAYRVDSIGKKIDALGDNLFELIGRLHPPEHGLVREYERKYRHEAKTGVVVLPLDAEVVYARASKVTPGMLAVTVPPERHGVPFAVRAMFAGRVLSVGTDTEGFQRIELSVAAAPGYHQRYERLSAAAVAVTQDVAVDAVIGSATASKEICVRVGLLDPQGRFSGLRALLPPMREPGQ